MSYYRYITGVYKSYWPQLNRSLRSSSVPRHVPQLDTDRQARSSSVPPSACFSTSFFTRNSATPFRDRALSVPPKYSQERPAASQDNGFHYSDFDYKVIDYMGKLERQDMVKSYVSESRRYKTTDEYDSVYNNRSFLSKTPVDSFSSRYNYYDGNKHGSDYLYPITKDVLGNWKHYNLSSQTLNERNHRATSPLVSRELDRYYGTQKRNDYLGSVSSGGATDFRYYNYRRVPYLGGSDHFKYLNKMVVEAVC
eukprot:GFUD01020940.1.p1 GENE.GFUD01020940.1~~GFUD01020940.1.p1  ORF type:complete len:252 (+),score=48.08 GFUD01020940.1:88-843(+)